MGGQFPYHPDIATIAHFQGPGPKSGVGGGGRDRVTLFTIYLLPPPPRRRFMVLPLRDGKKSEIIRAFIGINGAGQDRIIVVERRNGTGQDIPPGLNRRTGQDRISHRSKGRDGTGFVSAKILTGLSCPVT